MKRTLLPISMLCAAMPLCAQNLIHNPSFDSDTSGWNTSEHATWSNHVDHGFTEGHGSLQISTTSADGAAQCASLRGNTRYAFSVWSERDPQGSIAPCANGHQVIEISFYNGAECSGASNLTLQFQQLRNEPAGWLQHATDFATGDETKSALVALTAICPATSANLTTYYFDDVLLVEDELLRADFEEHAPSTGPSQPPAS